MSIPTTKKGPSRSNGLMTENQKIVRQTTNLYTSYSIFLKDFGGFKFSSLNLDGRYYFQEALYGLVGIDILRASGDGGSASDSKIALGVGYDLDMSDTMKLNLQAKYADQIVIGAGVVFSF
ncbi:MAG: hypothetical protein RIG77_10455 [Cyclobacteriaceae bacterium]